MILIGDWPDNFVKNVRFFEALEKEFGCTFLKKSEFVFTTVISKVSLTFQFCFGPLEDSVWVQRKELRKAEGRNLPPSIEELSRKKISCDELYYLGFCGVLNGRVNSFYLPSSAKEILFKKYLLGRTTSYSIKKKIDFTNILLGKINGKPCSLITSNQVLSLKYVEDNSEVLLATIAKLLRKEADVVEMENYEVVRRFGDKFPLGVLLYGGDSPLRKEHMIGSTSMKSMDFFVFVKGCLDFIHEIVR